MPEEVIYQDGRKLQWLYDAVGTMLRKTVYDTDATIAYQKNYIGGIEYNGNQLEAIYTREGRVVQEVKNINRLDTNTPSKTTSEMPELVFQT